MLPNKKLFCSNRFTKQKKCATFGSKGTGQMLVTDNTIRQCSRCGQELTDPASRECGVGPVCRHKDNDLYSKTIVANFAGATMNVMSIEANNLPEETRTRFEAMKMALLKRAEHAIKTNDDPMQLHLTGEDCRKIVREIDWLLSYRIEAFEKKLLIGIVKYLGYVGLAGVLSGKASTSKAKIWFDVPTGRVYLEGLGCTDGFREMIKISGIRTPKRRGDRTPYSAPVYGFKKFFENVREFWPCYEGNMEELEKECEQWIVANPFIPPPNPQELTFLPNSTVDAQPIVQPNDFASISVRSEDFIVTFPWIPGTSGNVVTKIKTEVNYKDRNYNPLTKAWTIKKKYFDSIQNILKENFSTVSVEETELPTPKPTYSNRSYYSRRRRW